MDIVHFSLPFHWPGGAGRSTENGDRRSDSAITPMAMILLTAACLSAYLYLSRSVASLSHINLVFIARWRFYRTLSRGGTFVGYYQVGVMQLEH